MFKDTAESGDRGPDDDDSGPAWLPWRRFRNAEERWGAMICGRTRCKRPSAWVSEATFMPARVVLCDLHVPENKSER